MRPPRIQPLSDRERDVLVLIARGATNKEIASRLCITINTVKTHVRRILGKMRVTNRTQAAVLLLGTVDNSARGAPEELHEAANAWADAQQDGASAANDLASTIEYVMPPGPAERPQVGARPAQGASTR